LRLLFLYLRLPFPSCECSFALRRVFVANCLVCILIQIAFLCSLLFVSSIRLPSFSHLLPLLCPILSILHLSGKK
jgi:hypothetical protein